MKKQLSIVIGLLLLLTACGHHEGIVTEKKTASFVVETPTGNPEEPEIKEMHLTDLSIFSGAIDSYEDLEEGDHVRVVPLKTDREFPYVLVSEVIVE